MPEAKRVEMFESSNGMTNEPRRDSEELIREINSTKTSNLNSLHPRGKVLYAEGERARGVYILRSGSASVSVSSVEGRVFILRVARAGDVLGLNSVLRRSLHATTVKTLEPSWTDFVSEIELRDLMVQSNSFNKTVLSIISNELAELSEHTKSLFLLQSTSARLAKLLLDLWSESGEVENRLVQTNEFTHEQIAQMIGCSRETVTRLISSFRRSRVIKTTPTGTIIVDPRALQDLAFGSESQRS